MNQQEKLKECFLVYFNMFKKATHINAVKHGLWKKEISLYQCIDRVEIELSEAREALENGNRKDVNCPEFTEFEIECADIMLTLMSIAEEKWLRLAEAMVAKHRYNKTRPYMHGKQF